MKIYPFIKRLTDILLSLIALILLSPIFLVVSIIIKLDSNGPIFFKQKRLGKDKTHFYILKFRTMRTETPKDLPTHLLQNPDVFITRVGRYLRKTSLDELPQLINIFKGEMSMVGPRPALWNQYDLIAERDRYGANKIRPGLTGLAQINGRDELSVEVKSRFDGDYVNMMSLWVDLKCVLGTVVKVVKSDGVVEGGAVKNRLD